MIIIFKGFFIVTVIHHPHDKLFRLSMEEPRVAQEFFSAHLPANLLKVINLGLLKLENHSFIDEAYRATEADIVFSVPQEDKTAYLYLLLEHQSEIDPLIAFRLLDIQVLPDGEMRRRRWSGLIEFALKHRKVIDFNRFLDQLFPWIHTLEQTDSAGFSLSKIVLKYVLNGTDVKGTELFIEKMHNYLSLELRGEVMTLAQQFRQEGIQQGEVAFFTRQLKHRFNQVPESYLKRIEHADAETLLSWGEKILDAKTLEEIFK